MRSIEWKTYLLGAAMLFAVAARAQDVQSIVFTPQFPAGYPEGIAWNERAGAFLVSSLRGGQIGQVALDGRYASFSSDRSLITTSGITIDTARNRVLVCNEDVGISHNSSPSTHNRVAQVLEFELDTGALQHVHDFSRLTSGPTLANDLTIDTQGNVYVTDSFQPQIYKVDAATREVSVLVRSERLMPADPVKAVGTQPYLNGIVYHPDGFLIVADYSRGLLWKVPLNEPKALAEIRLPRRLKGPDGLLLKSPTELVAVQSFPSREQGMSGGVTLLTSSDAWSSARIEAVATPPGLDGPTTATLKDGDVWVINSRYPRLFADITTADQVREFTILRADFKFTGGVESVRPNAAPRIPGDKPGSH
ncbi:SMP-30/gluconolactonase/LRE family protein [Pseudomonas aeruginosa]|uniref:SMP-30/gluconolactonase/LRE family protein n=1 Tax=Pseudomonas aeruginosa TaxID=287 RepID=UPI0009A31F43|nr:SMP-30/gluconolactonase/LRE family protein [Pseudomonas aeruginosa]EME5141366.1 SMP-30/gluconolactonase/LRE family protein [Pseudomonas aeruginosa]